MADTTYSGATAARQVFPGDLYRVTFRNAWNVSLALWRSWPEEVTRFVDKLPGSTVAFVIGTPAVDPQTETAVVVVRIAALAQAGSDGLTLGDVVRTLLEYFPGTVIPRVERIGGDDTSGADSELSLGAAAEAEAKRQRETGVGAWFGRLWDGVKGAGLAVLLVAAAVLLLYLLVRKRQAPHLVEA